MYSIQRNHDIAEFCKKLLRQPSCDFAVNIAHPVPGVIGTVQPDGQAAARFQKPGQNLDSLFAVGSVVQHSYAVDKIETAFGKGQLKYIRLEDGGGAVRQVLGGDLRGQTQIDANYVRAPAGRHLREPAHTATNVEHQFSRQILRPESRTPTKCDVIPMVLGIIQLRTRMHVPLKSKTTGISLCIDKADYAMHRGILPSAAAA